MRGLVLYADPDWHILIYQQGSNTSYLSLSNTWPVLNSGDEIEISGKTSWRNQQTLIDQQSIKVVGQGRIPAAPSIGWTDLTNKMFFNQMVRLSGRISDVQIIDKHLRLEMMLNFDHTATIMIRELPRLSIQELLGAKVALSGVNVTPETPGKDPTQVNLLVPDFKDIIVWDYGITNLSLLPAIQISDLQKLSPATNNPVDTSFFRRVRLPVTVLDQKSQEWLDVKDNTGQMRVPYTANNLIMKGDQLDLIGFPFRGSQTNPILHRMIVLQQQGTALTNATPASILPVLRKVAEIRALNVEEALRRYPVQLQGTVTYYDPQWRNLFIQDETGGVYIDTTDAVYQLETGQLISVSGVSDPGGFGPMVKQASIRVVGPGQFPLPKALTLEALNTGQYDSQWVEVEGVIRSVELNGDHVVMILRSPFGRFQATLPTLPPGDRLNRLIDSRVQIRGVCGVQANAFRQLVMINVVSPSWNHVEFISLAPADPFMVETQPIHSLLRFSPQNSYERRIKTRGIVTLARPDGAIYIQEGEAGIQIQGPKTKDLKPGHLVEVLGYISPGEYSPMLTQCEVKIVGDAPLPLAEPTNPSEILTGTREGTRISLCGRFLESIPGAGRVQLVIQAEEAIFHCVIQTSSERTKKIKPGSLLRLEGVCQVQIDEWGEIKSFRLLAQTWQDIHILSVPALWTLQRVLLLASILVGLLLGVLGWVALLRKQVRRQTETLRLKMQAEIAMEKRYRDLFENASDIIYTTDLDGNCCSLNRAAERIFGCHPQAGQPLWHQTFYSRESFHQLKEALLRISGTEVTPELQLEGINSQGQKCWLALKARVIYEQDQPAGYQCTARDITERRQLESQLLQAQKMEMVGQLAAGVAHDYNNLLTVISGHASLLQANPNRSSADLESCQEIAHAAERAAKLTRQLLAFSRRQVLQARTVNLNDVIQSTANMLRRLIGEDIHLTISPSIAPALAHVDTGMIEQVIVNLCVNARDAMPGGGDLTIRTECLTVNHSMQSSNSERKIGPHVRISVMDTGCGMSPEILSHIFEPYFTTKEVGKGTGLGLATVFGIVKQHDGWIEVESQCGKGTCFKVFLPQRSHPAAAPEAREEEKHSVQGRETILLVEDEPAVRIVARRTLERAGYRVLDADSGLSALRLWDQHRHGIDLLLTDMVMPGGLSGKDLSEQLLSQKPSLRIILSSGYNRDWAGLEVSLSQNHAILPKPYTSQALLKTVRETLQELAPATS